jgi:hypothetical protein
MSDFKKGLFLGVGIAVGLGLVSLVFSKVL